MIGGKDIIVPTRAGVQGLEVICRLIRRRWPRLVVEDAATGDQFADYRDLPLAAAPEILVYRDSSVAREWQEHGASVALCGTMIHAIATNDALTIVVDTDPSTVIWDLVTAIAHAVRRDTFNVTVCQGRAA